MAQRIAATTHLLARCMLLSLTRPRNVSPLGSQTQHSRFHGRLHFKAPILAPSCKCKKSWPLMSCTKGALCCEMSVSLSHLALSGRIFPLKGDVGEDMDGHQVTVHHLHSTAPTTHALHSCSILPTPLNTASALVVLTASRTAFAALTPFRVGSSALGVRTVATKVRTSAALVLATTKVTLTRGTISA